MKPGTGWQNIYPILSGVGLYISRVYEKLFRKWAEPVVLFPLNP